MLIFLEEYLQKKLKVAEFLYLYGKDFPREEASKNISLSTATLNQYVTEVYDDFKQEYQGGILLNSFSLESVCTRLFSESKKLEALRLLMVKPGKLANFYTDELMISSASFSRIIANLKEDLANYDIQILVRNGYRLEGKNDHYVVALSTSLSIFYKWPLEELYDELASFVGEDAAKVVCNLPDNNFPKVMNELSYNYYRLFLVKTLIRKYQFVADGEKISNEQLRRDCEECIAYLGGLVRNAEEQVHRVLPKIISNCYTSNIPVEKKLAIENLLVQLVSDYNNFPYTITSLSMRTIFFNRKYRLNNPERIPSIDTFIYRASDALRIDLKKRYEVIFYNLLTKDLLSFIKRSQVEIFVFSSIGEHRNEYLKEQLLPIMGYFSKDSTVETLDRSRELALKKSTLIVTTEILPQYPRNKQLLISDFISLQDYLVIMSWIIDKVTNEIVS